MSRANELASPVADTFTDPRSDLVETEIRGGLTIREEFAKAAMQGLLVGPSDASTAYVHAKQGLVPDTICAPGYGWPRYIAECAVEHADALIAELAKVKP